MISLFQIAPSDQSVVYLGDIFGIVSSSILSPTNGPMLLGILFRVFNTSILTLGVVVVIYTTVVGLLKTAQEGEFLGKQWSSLWIPLRTLFGIAALFPLPTGYCAIQVIFMWFIIQGVGAADTLWSTVMNYSVFAGSPATPSPTLGMIGFNTKMQTLYQALVCQASATAAAADNTALDGGTAQFYCSSAGPNNTSPFCTTYVPTTNTSTTVGSPDLTQVVSDSSDNIPAGCSPSTPLACTGTTVSFGPNGSCGTLTYCDEKDVCAPGKDYNIYACKICGAQKTALKQILPVLGNIASNFASLDLQYINVKACMTSQGASGSKNCTVPQWIQDYCNDPSRSSEDLYNCIMNAPSSQQVNDTFDTSQLAVQNVYLPFGIKPVVGSVNGATADFNAVINSFYQATVDAEIMQIQAQVMGNAVNTSTANTSATNQSPVGLNSILNAAATGGYWKQWEADAKNQGWILAGGYFLNIIQLSAQNINAGIPELDMSAMNVATSKEMQNYRNNYSAAASMIQQIQQQSAAANPSAQTASTNVPWPWGDIGGSITNASSSLSNGFQQALTSSNGQNPLIQIANYGRTVMAIIEALFWALLPIIFEVVATLTFTLTFAGTGAPVNPLGEATKAELGMFAPFLVMIAGMFYSLGAILGIYVPLIPFMIFTMGGIGWMLATVEAMVAAPIVALGILSPGGQHEILGRAEPALMLLLNLFLRPGLMVIGLMSATLVSIPAISLVNTAFTATLNTMPGGGLGIFEALMVDMFYASFVVTIISKCYSLIYVVPERVLTWIGGPAVQYGEEQALQASKQALEGAAQSVVGGAKETGGAVAHAGGAAGTARGYKEAEDKGLINFKKN